MQALVGLKPTVGLVSRSGIVPISHTQDTAGPMGRTVADVAALLSALAAVDPADPATAASKGHAWSEGTLIRLAYAYEQASHARRPPRLAASADLGAR